MSKDKLQDIRDRWTIEQTEGDSSNFFNLPYITHDEVVELMEIAYNQSLEDVLAEAKDSDHLDDIKQSILKLKIK